VDHTYDPVALCGDVCAAIKLPYSSALTPFVTGGTTPYSFTVDSCDGGGQITVDAATSTITFNQRPLGTATCHWSVADAAGAMASASITYSVYDPPLTAENITAPAEQLCVPTPSTACARVSLPYTTVFHTAVHGGTAPFTYAIGPCQQAGQLVPDDANQTLTTNYSPLGTATCQWTVTDAAGQTATASYSYTVYDPPITADDISEQAQLCVPSPTIACATSSLAYSTVFGNSVHGGTPPYTYAVGSCQQSGQLVTDDARQLLTFDPAQAGTATCRWTVTDAGGETATATLTYAVVSPLAVSDVSVTQQYNTASDPPYQLSATPAHPGDPVTYTVGDCAYNGATSPDLGLVSATSDGQVAVNLVGSGFSGTIVCTITAVDTSTGDRGQARLTVSVPAAVKPTASDLTVTQTYDTNSATPYQLQASATPSTDPLRFSLDSCVYAGTTRDLAAVTISPDGAVTVHLDGSDFLPKITCTFTVTDTVSGLTDKATFTVYVNDAPPTLTVTSNKAVSIVGDPVTLVARTVPIQRVVPTGSVTFFDGTSTLGSAPLDSTGTARLTLTSLGGAQPYAVHSIGASYGGDAYYAPASAVRFDQLVIGCGANVSQHVLSATTNQGTIRGVFCINRSGAGTYTQAPIAGHGIYSGQATLSIKNNVTQIWAQGTGLSLSGQSNKQRNTFTESAPLFANGTFSVT
jgi:hypothetical protein